jgi:hypothetical protein
MEGVAWTKSKYTFTAGIHRQILLNIDLDINNERQDCKKGSVCGGGLLVGGGRANEGD